MAEAFELYASFKIDTSGYTQELNKIRQEMQQFQQELNSFAVHPTFDGGRFRTELQQAQQQSTQATEEIQRLQQQIQSLQQAADGGSGDSGGGVLSGFLSQLDVIGDIASGQFLANMAVNGINSIIDSVTGSIDESIGLASDLVETQNVVDVTFEDSASTINKWAQEALNAYGITETKAKQYSSTLGAMLKSMGIADDQVLQMSMDMAGLAADMASFYNLDHDTAFEKIRSGISGETEPLKALGLNLSVANLNAFALEKGMNKAFDKMSQAEQATLRYQYLLEATKDAQGDFARTGDSFSNEMRKLQTNLDRIKTEFGKGLLGVVTPAISLLNNVLSVQSYQYTDAAKDLIERNESIYEAQATYAQSMTIMNAMRNMEEESGDAIKSTNEWKDALEDLKNVMPGLARYVDLTSDAIVGNTESISKYVDTLNGVSLYAAHEEAVSNAKEQLNQDKQYLAELEAQKRYIQEQIAAAGTETVKAANKSALDSAYAYFKSTVPYYDLADTYDEFVKYSFGHISQRNDIERGRMGNRHSAYGRLNDTQEAAWQALLAAENNYNDPTASLIEKLKELDSQIAETSVSINEETAAFEKLTAEQEEFNKANKEAKWQYDFNKSVDAQKQAFADLKTALGDLETYQADTLAKMEKSYRGLASGLGFMVTHTEAEFDKLVSGKYSEKNVMGWFENNAESLKAYNDALEQAKEAGYDPGILAQIAKYSTENDALLARYLSVADDPEKVKKINAGYQATIAEENRSAQIATDFEMASDEKYQSLVKIAEQYVELYNQSSEITSAMAKNKNAFLGGIDDLKKALEEELPGINELLEKYGFVKIKNDYEKKPWVHDFGGAREGYADMFDDVANDKNAFSKEQAKALHAIEARSRSGYADMIEDGLMPDDIKARAQRWNRLVEMKTQEMNDIVDILEQRMEENQRQREAEEAEQWNNRATKDMPPLYMMDTIIANAAHPKFVPNTYIGAPSSEQQEKTTGGNFFSAIESAIAAAKEIESRTIQEGFVTQSIFNTLGEMMENYKESLKNNSAPNIFSNGDGVLFVQVTNPGEIANAVSGLPPTTINNTFSVDGKTVATAVAPIVNKIIGRGIRGNLMEVAR
nr:MAG TPA: minor tail protein [Caudoviricetes sp.]